MTPTSFTFTLTMPGDDRFVGAVRQLAAQAASYAQLPAEAGEALAGEVQQATKAAIAASGSAPLEFTFSGDEAHVAVRIGCNTPRPVSAPASSRHDSVSVNWTTEGSRLTCTIQRPAAA